MVAQNHMRTILTFQGHLLCYCLDNLIFNLSAGYICMSHISVRDKEGNILHQDCKTILFLWLTLAYRPPVKRIFMNSLLFLYSSNDTYFLNFQKVA